MPELQLTLLPSCFRTSAVGILAWMAAPLTISCHFNVFILR